MRRLALRMVGVLWVLGQASCGARGDAGPAGAGGCGDLSGVWSVTGSCAPSDCTVTQSGCSLSVSCASGTRLMGTVSGASFVGSGTTGARVAGTCTGTFAAGTLDGECATAGGACGFSARCSNGACGAAPSGPAGELSPGEFCARFVAAHEPRRVGLGCPDVMLQCAPGVIRLQGVEIANVSTVRRASADQCAAGLAAAQDCDELDQAFFECTRVRQM